MDSETGEELRHPKGECIVKGLVLVKIIYTPEEAARHKEEDTEVIVVFEKARKQVGVFEHGPTPCTLYVLRTYRHTRAVDFFFF